MNAMIWLILFVVLVVFEIATMGLTTIWFAAGALIAFCVTSSCYVVAPVRILYCGFADNADFYKTICIAICESAYHKDEYRQCYRTDWACYCTD